MDMDWEAMFFQGRLVFASAFSIIMWEQAMSCRDEYTLVWTSRTKWSLAKVLFVLNRYCAMLGLLMYTIWFVAIPVNTCIHIHFLPTVFCIISLIVGDMILALRVWAMWERNLFVGLGLGSIKLGIIGFNVWFCQQSTGVPNPAGPCLSLTHEGLQTYEYLANTLCVGFELIAIVLIVTRVYKYRKGGARGGLVDNILRDSIHYFVMVFSVKLLNALNFMLNKSSPNLFFPIAVSVCSIMCSRVFFGLVGHIANQSTHNSSTGWYSSTLVASKNATESAFDKHHAVHLRMAKQDEDLELKGLGNDMEQP